MTLLNGFHKQMKNWQILNNEEIVEAVLRQGEENEENNDDEGDSEKEAVWEF